MEGSCKTGPCKNFWTNLIGFFEDIYDYFFYDAEGYAKDRKIKQLEDRIRLLEIKGQIKSDEAQKIRDYLMADLEISMCTGLPD